PPRCRHRGPGAPGSGGDVRPGRAPVPGGPPVRGRPRAERAARRPGAPAAAVRPHEGEGLMLAYIARRLVFSVFVLWGAVTIVFAVLRVVPGDPALIILGPDAQQSEIDALRESLGLNDALVVQYVNYLWDVLHLDFGTSLRMGGDAMGHVVDRMPMTALLALVAVVIAVVVGLTLGIVAALNANSVVDRVVTVLSLAGQSA